MINLTRIQTKNLSITTTPKIASRNLINFFGRFDNIIETDWETDDNNIPNIIIVITRNERERWCSGVIQNLNDNIDTLYEGNKNVTYIGNAFPHNYADAWDDERGMMILEWGGEPKYINWPDMPRYRTIKISELLADPEKVLKPQMYVRVTLNIKISYEEANFIRETFIDKYQLRELQLIPEQINQAQQPLVNVQKFDSVDQIVLEQLKGVDSETYDRKILMAIYNNLDVNN